MDLDNKGTTLIEILVSVAIIGIMSSIFLVNIRTTDRERLTIAAEQLAADLRQIRNMSASRSIYDMSGILEYPQGGYALEKNNDKSYFIYADNSNDGVGDYYNTNEDELIKEVNFEGVIIENYTGNPISYYFKFIKDHEINTNLTWEDTYGYAIKLSLDTYSILVSLNYNPANNGWGNIEVGDIY